MSWLVVSYLLAFLCFKNLPSSSALIKEAIDGRTTPANCPEPLDIRSASLTPSAAACSRNEVES